MPTKEYRYKHGSSKNSINSPTRFLNDHPHLSQVLTDEKTSELFQQYWAGQAALQIIIQSEQPVTEHQLQDLTDTAINGFHARNELWLGQLLLVVYLAKKRNDLHSPLEDLIQEGAIGALTGIEKYDPNKGSKLSSYAALWMKSAMKRFDQADHTIHIPENLLEVLHLIKQSQPATSDQPTHQYLLEGLLAQELIHWDGMEYELLEKEPFADSRDYFLQVLEEAGEINLQEVFEKILTVQEELVIKLYFGLGYNTSHEMHEIADILQVTKRRIFTVRKKAIDKLKKYFDVTEEKDRNQRVPN